MGTVKRKSQIPSLGRWDCGANVLQPVANMTGYTNSVNQTNLYFNTSYLAHSLTQNMYQSGLFLTQLPSVPAAWISWPLLRPPRIAHRLFQLL